MNRALTWRLLNETELTQVYNEQMRRDFPPEELKPLDMILHAAALGVGHTWGVFDGETLLAYLLMVRPQGSCISQLDYFAVLPAYRGEGLGAQLLAELPAHEQGAQAIIIEAECPEHAPDEAMAHRRLGFYARAGAIETGWSEHLFDAWFRILVLPCVPWAELPTEEEMVRRLAECYCFSISPERWRAFVRFFRPDGSTELFEELL
jgi:GNAT superfamily N-acetyltransferase